MNLIEAPSPNFDARTVPPRPMVASGVIRVNAEIRFAS